MPDRWPYRQVIVMGYVSLFVSCFGLVLAIDAGHWIAWVVGSSALAVFLVDAIALALLRARWDRTAQDGSEPNAVE